MPCEAQNSHSYYLDYIPSILKANGLWGGIAIAWKSHKPEKVEEFSGENPLLMQSQDKFFHFSSNFTKLKFKTVKW